MISFSAIELPHEFAESIMCFFCCTKYNGWKIHRKDHETQLRWILTNAKIFYRKFSTLPTIPTNHIFIMFVRLEDFS